MYYRWGRVRVDRLWRQGAKGAKLELPAPAAASAKAGLPR
jgi:hypothetical protein